MDLFSGVRVLGGLVDELNHTEAVTVVDEVVDTLLNLGDKVTHPHLVVDVRLDCRPLLFGLSRLVVTLPLDSTVVGEDCSDVVGVEVVADLTKLRDVGRVLPPVLSVVGA